MSSSLRCNCSAQTAFSLVELAPGLTARHCEGCGGSLLALDEYEHWNERNTVPSDTAAPLAQEEYGVGVRICPSCTRLMNRYRVGAKPDFRVDRCAPCQSVWFDRGEWPALIQAQLAGKLGQILSDAWQRQVQAEEVRATREAALRSKHGDACMDELARIRAWLDAQPQRDELVALLRAGW
jgi:Zn-finger nucleic acid-binding protein